MNQYRSRSVKEISDSNLSIVGRKKINVRNKKSSISDDPTKLSPTLIINTNFYLFSISDGR